MHVLQNRSVVLEENEVRAVAKLIELGHQLVEQLGAQDQGAVSDTVEYNMYTTLEVLEAMGISSDELTKPLVSIPCGE